MGQGGQYRGQDRTRRGNFRLANLAELEETCLPGFELVRANADIATK